MRPGFEVRTVSAYVVYYSTLLPNGTFQPTLTRLPSDVGAGGSAELDWTRFSDRTNIVFTYTPSYTGRVRFSGTNALNHASSIHITRKLAPRWTLTLSGSASLSSLDQFLFSPTAYGDAASLATTFDDLASAMLAGKFSDPRMASILGGARVSESPLTTLLYGDRMLTSTGQASLSYSYSPRLSITVSGSGVRNQHISDNAPVSLGNSYLVRDTTSETAAAAFSYSLSPRTQVGGTVSGGRVYSPLQDAYNYVSVASLGRKLSPRWFAQVQAGLGGINVVRAPLYPLSSYEISSKPRPTVQASVGFKSFSHTLLGSFDHTASDQYGLGATTSSSANASWKWRRPGLGWSLAGSMGWQQLTGSLIGTTSGWRATVGMSRPVGQMTVLVEYAFQSYFQNYYERLRAASDISQNAVRLSVVWEPGPPIR